MGISTFPPIGSGPMIDISTLSEHQIANTAVDLTSLTTLASVTGKGILEQALLFLESSTVLTTVPEIVITVDGEVVYDVGMATGTLTTSNKFDGIYTIGSVVTNGSANFIFGADYMGVLSNYGVSNASAGLAYPISTQQILALNIQMPIGLENPIYFNQSLLVEVKGKCSSGSIKAGVKVRY